MKRKRTSGHLEGPTAEEVKELAKWLNIPVTDDDARKFSDVIHARVVSVSTTLDELPEPRFEVRYPRTPGFRPTVEEDPLNLFITRCHIDGAATGRLAGKRAALKDSIAVAGLPMTNGSRDLRGVVPQFDAVVAERLLDAGASIVGKLNQDDFAHAATGDTSSFGAARNPLNPEYSAGGSSSAQGAAVRAGAADLALGVDQAGSGRIPAAWTGVCAIKATHGLVPSFGLFHMSHTLDHVCPAARTVEEVAVALEVLAGDDVRDPQWVRGEIRVEAYAEALGSDIRGLRIGLVKEAFGWDVSEPDVDEAVRDVAGALEAEGAVVSEVSVPLWGDAWAIWFAIVSAEESTLLESNLQGYFHGGHTSPELAQAIGSVRRRGLNLPPRVKTLLLLGLYLRRKYDNVYYCRGQNVRHVLRRQVDDALSQVDVLLTPTTPMKPVRLAEKPMSVDDWSHRLGTIPNNTIPLDLTGHPALVMPCEVGEEHLPISAQFIGRHWDERRLFAVAHAFERLIPGVYGRLEARTAEVLATIGGTYGAPADPSAGSRTGPPPGGVRRP
jgi:amidase